MEPGSHNFEAPKYKIGSEIVKPTPRQLEILALVREGHTNRRIGLILRTSEQTVKNHIYEARARLRATDRTSAVITAIRKGYLGLYGRNGQLSHKDSH